MEKSCRRCGYNLTNVREPVQCPQCGTMHSDSTLGESTVGERLIVLNSIAFLLALFIIFPARGGFGWFPFGSGAGLAVCIVIPLQVYVPFWALHAYVAREKAGPTSRWHIYGVIAPFVLGLLSLVAVLGR